jgi:predicted Zn-dependent peptidase
METVRLDREIFQTTAPNGLVVLSERVPSVRSAALGVWVRTASAHESPPTMGVSHLLEHMVFKGTERRTAQQIALALEARGGSLDAYTSRDATAFHARVLDADLPDALDVLTDLVRRPVLRTSDLELERNVVLEEINTVLDTPDDLVFDLSARQLWPAHPYGYSILGTRESVSTLSATDLKRLHERAYFPGNCVIAAAGNLTHERLLELVAAQGWFDNAGRGTRSAEGAPPVPAVTPAVRGGELRHPKDTAQTHIVFATDSVSYADRRKYALLVLANVFGGGMSSRLFQRVREELGLAYAVYSFTTFYRQMGVLGVYVGTQPKTAEQAAGAIREEYARLAREPLVGDALAEAKQQTQGQLMLSLESPSARMYRLAGFRVYGERYQSLDEIVATVGALTADEVAAVAAEFFAPERQAVVTLGPENNRG